MPPRKKGLQNDIGELRVVIEQVTQRVRRYLKRFARTQSDAADQRWAAGQLRNIACKLAAPRTLMVFGTSPDSSTIST